MKYKVEIELKTVAESNNLAEACKLLMEAVMKMVKAKQMSKMVLKEACWIECESVPGIMNFYAVKDFLYAFGIMVDGEIVDFLPEIHEEVGEIAFRAASIGGLMAYLNENEEMFKEFGLLTAVVKKFHEEDEAAE